MSARDEATAAQASRPRAVSRRPIEIAYQTYGVRLNAAAVQRRC
jgi:hypothetical protein